MFKRIIAGIGTIGGYAALSCKVENSVSHPNNGTHEDSFDYDVKQGSYTKELIEGIQKQTIVIPSRQDYELFGYWMPNGDSNKTVILCHGITSTIYGALKYYELYHNMGYNVLAYDHRNHGLSGGEDTTYGYHERHDLQCWVEWVKDEVVGGIIGTHGESMGAAVALQHIGVYDNLDFVVSDCSYSDLHKELDYVIKKENKIPLWFGVWGASLISYLKGNGFYKDASPVKLIRRTKTPILFIHGDSDSYILPEHVIDLYQSKKEGIRELYLAKGAEHAVSIIVERETYTKVVTEFLELALEG